MMKRKTLVISAVLAVLLICVSGLAACGATAPKGYSNEFPIIDATGEPAFYGLHRQFEKANEPVNLYCDKAYFLYGEAVCFVQANEDTGHWASDNSYTVYKDSGRENIGDFIDISERGLTEGSSSKWNCDIIFLNDSYLYYGIRLMERKNYLRLHPDGFTDFTYFYKFEFYRFDLESGENESVGLDLFFEKLSILDNTVVLNN